MLHTISTRYLSSLQRRLGAAAAGCAFVLALVVSLGAAALAGDGGVQQPIILLGLLFGAGFAVLGWFAAPRILAPLTRFAASAQRIESGDTTAVLAAGDPDEVGQIARVFERLTIDLAQRGVGLELAKSALDTAKAALDAAKASVEAEAASRANAEQRAQELSDEITVRQQVEDSLQDSRDTLARIIELTFEGIAISVNREIMYANRTLLNTFGYSSSEMLGLAEDLLIAPEAREKYAASLDSTFFEIDGIYIDGGLFPIEIFKRPIIYYGQQARILFIRDITQRKHAENEMKRLYSVTSEQLEELQQVYSQLSFQAAHDHLTGLVNRKHFEELLSQALENTGEHSVSLMYIDLDRFKLVNDTLGHAAGDDLLRQVTQRLGACAPGGTLARLGGDEFALLLPLVTDTSEPVAIARQMLAVLQEPFELGDTSIVITSSIGVGFYPSDAQTMHQLFQKTDAALYEAKALGRNNFRLASEIVEKDLELHTRLERDLHRALERNEFRLEYQPQYHLQTGAITGFEALLRWYHPELGLISPTEFIPMAEETGLILPIGQWVLEEACRAVVSWQASHAGVTVAVNVSTLQAEQAQFGTRVLDTLKAQGAAPELVELEITESLLMHDRDIATLQTLCDAGMRFALDDFGTGYSSLRYLQRLPVTVLKIDRSFVDEMHADNLNALVNAMITMAHGLNMQVIAEGVENHTQLQLLAELQCDAIQGFLIGKAMPPDAVIPFLDSFAGVPAP